MPGTIEVAAGPVRVLHRLALGVEPIDAITGLRVGAGLRVGREVPPRRRRDWVLNPLAHRPVVDLERSGARFKLRHGDGVRVRVTIRIDDPGRRWVGRRFDVALWTLAEVEAVDQIPPVGPTATTGMSFCCWSRTWARCHHRHRAHRTSSSPRTGPTRPGFIDSWTLTL